MKNNNPSKDEFERYPTRYATKHSVNGINEYK